MAFERISDTKIKGDGLDSFVESRIQLLTKQRQTRNAEDELRFNTAVLESNLTLDDQLGYRKKQLERVSDDPEERKRIRLEVANLNDRIEQKKFSDDYIEKLIGIESGMTGVEDTINWLRDRKLQTTDQNIKDTIEKQLIDLEGKKFQIQKTIIENQTTYALHDKSGPVLDGQLERVSKIKNDALLSGNNELVSIYDLQIQALNQAKTENSIANTLKNFSVSTMTGNSSATGLLDQYNGKISQASSTSGPITIDGTRYNSEEEFWRVKRDSYVADESKNGFFGRYSSEQTETLKTKYSSNLLTNDIVKASAESYNSLVSRPELAAYQNKITNEKQSVLQTGVDLRANTLISQYAVDSDVNKAVNNLTVLKTFGANVDQAMTQILTDAADIKLQQVQGINQAAAELMKKGVAPEQAIDTAVKEGAATYLSPEQLSTKSAADIARETQQAGQNQAFTTPDNRTTVQQPQNVNPAVPSVVPQPQNLDLSSKYGKVGAGIYRKSDGKAFTNPTEFFADSGVSSFAGLKFDESYKPPVANASPQLQKQPTATPTPTVQAPATPQTYKVSAGDNLSTIAQKLLGSATRYTEIAKANNISNPNLIKVGQVLTIPNK